MKHKKITKIKDDTVILPEKAGNGILRTLISVDGKGEVIKYNLTYINFRLCKIDNGRVLGYDNNHGYHHRHYMGKEESVKFNSFKEISKQFEKEWRALHEKAKKHHH